MLELNFTPFPLIQTDRLVLRQISMEDSKALMHLRQDDLVMEFIDRPKMKSVEEAEKFIENILASQDKNEAILWVIAEKDKPGIMIGTIGFWRIAKEHYRAEIGYMLHHDFWQKGIMKEAATAVINWLFLNTQIHSIEANLDAMNIASDKLLQSLGFIKEGHFRENYFYKGKFTDSALYSILRNSPRT